MLHGHLITSFLPFQAAFLQSLSSGPDFPEGFHRERYIQMLNTCSLHRPQTTIEQEFPMLDRKHIITFALDPEDRRRSNDAYNMFKKSRKPGAGMESLRAGSILYRPSSMLAILCWLSSSLRGQPWQEPCTSTRPWTRSRKATKQRQISSSEPQLEYNGRLGPIKRHFIIKKAFKATPPQVMLTSRATR
ncbi:hypothetical protein ACKLNR_009491 [Fusarium oxysporum f. sp. zingiberi]